MESEKRRDTGCDGKGEHRRGCAKKEAHLFLFPLPRGTKFRNCHTHFTSVSKCRSFELRATRSTSTCGLQVHGSFCVMSSVCVAFVGKGMNYELLATAGPLEPDEPATSGDLRCPPPKSLPRPLPCRALLCTGRAHGIAHGMGTTRPPTTRKRRLLVRRHYAPTRRSQVWALL